MGEATAGRLLSALAAIAGRHFGATLLAAAPVAEERPAARADAPSGSDRDRAVERLF
jgi:hypothetical protein